MKKKILKYSALLALFIAPIGWGQVSTQPSSPAPAAVQAPQPELPAQDTQAGNMPVPGGSDMSSGGYGMAGGMSSGMGSGRGGGMMMGGMGMMGGTGYGASNNRSVQVFELKNRAASEIQEILIRLVMDSETVVQADERTNRIIVVAQPKDIKNIENLIQTLDIPVSKNTAQESSLNVTYQVFAVEAKAPGVMGGSGIPFTLQVVLHAKEQNAFNQFLAGQDSIAIKDMKSEVINQDDRKFTIQGMATSEENFNHFLQELQNAVQQLEIVQRSLENSEIQSPYQVPEGIEIPEKVQSVIQRFLGGNTEIVAYWFGNSTVPGRSKARLGEFELQMNTEPGIRNTFGLTVSLRKDAANVLGFAGHENPFDFHFSADDVDPVLPGTPSAAANAFPNVPAEQWQNSLQDERQRAQADLQLFQKDAGAKRELLKKGQRNQWAALKSLDALRNTIGQDQVVLENTVTCRVGQPVVIGYTRQDHNVTRQGALVLVPETEMAGAALPGEAETTSSSSSSSSTSSSLNVQTR